MEWKSIFPILDKYFSQDRCLEHVTRIWETDHLISFDQFEKTARYCASIMEETGLTEIELLPLKADGHTCYNDWKLSRAWKVHHGILSYPNGETICDYAQVPCSLTMYSPGTDGPVEAEVVNVCGISPFPTDGSLAGKLLLTDRRAGAALADAQNAGAAGILSCSETLYPGIRSREDIYDTVLWEGMGCHLGNRVFGFKLTPRQADRLKKQLEAGPVRLVADIQTEAYDGVCYTVSGLLEGREPGLPEVLAYGHLYEPGANDNASGSGALLEMARCFRDAIELGMLPRPRRSIRFAVGWECGGSMGYTAAHPDRDTLCAGVFDMVGTEEIDKTMLSLRYDPMANLSFGDPALDLSARLCQEYLGTEKTFDRYPFRRGLGTDNILGDPCFNSPSIALVAAPATSYHSSMDTPDRVQPEILKRNAMIMAAWLYGLADADEATCALLKEELESQTKAALSTESEPRLRQQILEGHQRVLYSMNRICPGLGYEAPAEETPELPGYAREAGTRIPVRLVRGPLTLALHPAPADAPWHPGWNAQLNIPLFWADGKRNLWQITCQTAFELGTPSDGQLEAKYNELLAYFTFLEQQGYIRW